MNGVGVCFYCLQEAPFVFFCWASFIGQYLAGIVISGIRCTKHAIKTHVFFCAKCWTRLGAHGKATLFLLSYRPFPDISYGINELVPLVFFLLRMNVSYFYSKKQPRAAPARGAASVGPPGPLGGVSRDPCGVRDTRLRPF